MSFLVSGSSSTTSAFSLSGCCSATEESGRDDGEVAVVGAFPEEEVGARRTGGKFSARGGEGILTSSLVFGVKASSPIGEIGVNPSGGPEETL